MVAGELDEITAALGLDSDTAPMPHSENSRHSLFRVDLGADVVWIKLEAVRTSMESVLHEGTVLRDLHGRGPFPELLHSGVTRQGRSFIVTREVAGIQLARLPVMEWSVSDLFNAREAFEACKSWLPAHHSADRYDSHASPLVCFDASWREQCPDLLSIVERLTVGKPPAREGAVHGSFEPRNIISTPSGGYVLVDFEASRQGPIAFDWGTMLLGIVAAGGKGETLRAEMSSDDEWRVALAFALTRLSQLRSRGDGDPGLEAELCVLARDAV